jgi:hypothetical protein
MDFLVTGDDFNINSILLELGSLDPARAALDENSTAGGLLSSVDHGRPAQAVSNWVQCENPECMKWRKVPWHVDIDMLSEKFFCKENVWNPKSASCDAPAEDWDETTDARVEADGSAYAVESTPKAETTPTEPAIPACKLADFKLGGKTVVAFG